MGDAHFPGVFIFLPETLTCFVSPNSGAQGTPPPRKPGLPAPQRTTLVEEPREVTDFSH